MYETDPVFSWFITKQNKTNILCFPISCTSAHTGGYISPKFREGRPYPPLSPLHLYLPHRPLTAQGETQPEMHCRALNVLWIALVSQEPAFHVSDFPQGSLMLIHFTLLTHLFFFMLSYLFWAFKYICGRKKKTFSCHCAVSETKL